MPTKIEWVQNPDGTKGETWNPVTGCTPISAGCKHCYAERVARRLAGRHGYPPAPHHFDVTLHPDRLDQPLRWHKPRMIFVCSMSDWLHPDVPFSFAAKMFAVMASANWHTYQLLTKRPERLEAFFKWSIGGDETPLFSWPLDNVRLGVTAENQKAADERIPLLLRTPAAVRFLSCEPMLGEIDLYLHSTVPKDVHGTERWRAAHEFIHWVIVGGESGPGARPMHPDWARSLRDQCQSAGVPFFMKQWGGWIPNEDGCGGGFHFNSKHICLNLSGECFDGWVEATGERIAILAKATKKAAGRMLDGRTWDQMPATMEEKP